jgi:hypothetical protein
MTSGRNEILNFTTKDISKSGIFIYTISSFPEGTRFILDFTFPIRNIQTLKDVKSLKDCLGSLVRSTPHGIGIQFDRECQIENLVVS